MWKKTFLALAASLALVTMTLNTAQAAIELNITSSSDLLNLNPGETATIDVELSGLSGTQLSYLAATISFSDALLGTPFNLVAGSIIPDAAGFVGSTSAGSADGNYDFLFTANSDLITSDGIFFSFDVTAGAAGQGEIAFDFTDMLDDVDEPVDYATNGARFVINRGQNTVPEPSSFIILTTLGLGYGWSRLRRRA